MLRQISLAWSNIKNNRTIGLLSLDNWHGVNLFGVMKTTVHPHWEKMGKFGKFCLAPTQGNSDGEIVLANAYI